MNPCNFSFSHYRKMIKDLQEQEYTFFTFSEYTEKNRLPDKRVLLRHDIDRSVTKALCLARIEKECGVQATYFVRLHSNYYNPFGHVCYNQLREIISLEHEMGLHSEYIDAARIAREEAVQMFDREIRIFEMIVQKKCRIFSLHRTTGSSSIESQKVQRVDIKQSHPIACTYDEIFQKELKYLSDSSGFWREGCLCNHIGGHAGLHVLTHPDWWFAEHIELEEPVV